MIIEHEPNGCNYVFMTNNDGVVYIWLKDGALNIRTYAVKTKITNNLSIGADALPQVLEFINKELKRTDEPEILNWLTWELDLSVRARNVFKYAGIEKVRDLVRIKSGRELLKYRNFGKLSLTEITEWLTRNNLYFGMEV